MALGSSLTLGDLQSEALLSHLKNLVLPELFHLCLVRHCGTQKATLTVDVGSGWKGTRFLSARPLMAKAG